MPLPNVVPQEITVATILTWANPGPPAGDAPRTGREQQLFHIAHGFLQNTFLNPGDCDLHFEISDVADKNAPRVVVETPSDDEYCSARRNIQSQLASLGINYPAGADLPNPVQVDVIGLAFLDFEHKRGSNQVKTDWELHPAIVTVIGQ